MKLHQIAADRMVIVERFREDLEKAKWNQHL